MDRNTGDLQTMVSSDSYSGRKNKKHRKNKLYSDKFGKFCIRLEKDAARVEKYNFREVCCFENSRADKTECANQGK